MNGRTPVELAQDIASGNFSTEALEYFSGTLRKYFDGGGTLEDCMGLTVARRKKFRNTALIRAASILKDSRDIDYWSLAGELMHALARFDRLRDRHNRPSLAPLDRCLYDARNSGCEQLNSQKSLRQLLMENL